MFLLNTWHLDKIFNFKKIKKTILYIYCKSVGKTYLSIKKSISVKNI